jgi:NAD(P)H-binding
MSAEKFLVTGATGRTGRHTVQHLLEKGHAVRALVHQEDERSEALRSAGAEVVVGDLLEHDDTIGGPPGPAPPTSVIRFVPGSSKRRLTSRTRPSGRASKRLLICRRSLRARIPTAMRHAITGSPNASSTGLVCPPSMSARLSSRNG